MKSDFRSLPWRSQGVQCLLVRQRKKEKVHQVAGEVELYSNLFVSLINGSGRVERNRSFVVQVQNDWWRGRMRLKRHNKAAKSNGLLGGVEYGDLLCLARRCSNKRLFAGSPAYECAAQEKDISAGGATGC